MTTYEVDRDTEIIPVKYKDQGQPSRVTVVGSMYFQGSEGERASAHTQYQRVLESTEQVYERRCKVGEEWEPVDLGWLDKDGAAAIIHIKNEEGTFKTVPTEEEVLESEEKVLELAFRDTADCWLIRPTDTFRGEPLSMNELMIRCRKGTARYSIFLVPN